MPLHQEVTKFMADAEACRFPPTPGVDQNAPLTSLTVGEEDPFTAVERILAHLRNAETTRDLLDRYRAIKATDLAVQRPGNPQGIMQIGEIDAIELQRPTPGPWMSFASI